MTLQQALSQVLFAYRDAAGLSQEKLAELSDIHRTYISQIERGLKSPTITTIFAICNALGIKSSQFVKDIENVLSS